MNGPGSNKICNVCGDKSIGRNFGAITCYSCKAFFRRTANKNKRMQCFNGDKCDINVKTRKVCKMCRLMKCYSIGMKKELIFDEAMKEKKNNLIELNRLNRQINNLEIDLIIAPESTFLSNNNNNNHNSVETNDSFLQKLILFKLNDNNFNSLEFKRLSELLNASNICFNPLSQNILSITDEELYFRVIVIKFECDVERIANFSKKLSPFENICENDRIALVKYACIDVVSMRYLYCFNQDKKYWTIHLKDNYSASLTLETFEKFKRHKVFRSRANGNQRPMGSSPVWDWDPIVMDLLTAIVLFNPNRPNVIHKDVIQLEQQIYIHLLKRYLRIHFRSELEANSKFCEFINALKVLITASHDVLKYNLNVNYSQYYGPLMKEVLDL